VINSTPLSPWDCKKVSRQEYHALGTCFNPENAFKSKHILFSFPFFHKSFQLHHKHLFIKLSIKKSSLHIIVFYHPSSWCCKCYQCPNVYPLNNRGKCFIKINPLGVFSILKPQVMHSISWYLHPLIVLSCKPILKLFGFFPQGKSTNFHVSFL